MDKNESDFDFDVKTAAKLLRKSTRTLRRWREIGVLIEGIDYIWYGGRIMFSEKALREKLTKGIRLKNF